MITERLEQNITRVPIAGCWLWTKSVGSHGYGQLMFPDHKPRLVHRLAYEEWVGAIPHGLHVLHRCDVRSCCNPDHLFIGTAKDNMQDCKAKGRLSKPPAGRAGRLTQQQRDSVRARYLGGESSRALAQEFAIDRTRVTQIARCA